MHPCTDASGRLHWRRREKGVFGRGRPWQGGHGQWLGGLGSDAPCVGGSDLRGQRQAGRGSWYWELGNSRSWRRRPKYISLVSLVWNLAPLVYLLFKISFPPLLETSKWFFFFQFSEEQKNREEERKDRKDDIQDPSNHNRGALHS